MKLMNIGGATAIIEHKGKRILFDPWLDEGIFYGSWYHFPPAQVGISDLGKIDYIYISHIHEDHCSAGTLKHLNKDAEIIIMDRDPNYVAKFLERNQFGFKKIHLIREKTPTLIAPGLTVDMLTADPAHDSSYLIDSALILKWDDFVIYNANDCRPYPAGLDYILSTYKKVNLALLPFTGGSGYPACYVNLTDEVKLKEQMKIRNYGYELFASSFETLRPDYIVPFADQYVVAGSRSHLNRHLPHPPTPGAVYETMEKKGYLKPLLLLNSGQVFDFESKEKIPNTPYYFHTDEDRDRYVEEKLTDKLYDYEKFPHNSAVPIDRLLKHSRVNLWSEQEKGRFFPDFRYYIEAKDRNRTFKIDLREQGIVEVKKDTPFLEPYIKMSCPSNLLVFMMTGQISWNMADAALLIDYVRIPNTYDPKLYTYINYIKL